MSACIWACACIVISTTIFHVLASWLMESSSYLVEFPPMLLSAPERVNALHLAILQMDNALKATHLKDDHGREHEMLQTLLNAAVAASEATNTATTNLQGK